jgi:pSer/pThr/pTyr-binding forkhead associated (FHA) protein
LDINPPKVGVSDLGSLNGTYVNGTAIGAGGRGRQSEPGELPVTRELHSGDELQLGSHAFRVDVLTDVPFQEGEFALCACGAGV